MTRPPDLFERQYGDKALQYRESFPRLRRLLRPWSRDRFEVTRGIVARLAASGGEHRLLDFGCGDGRIARLVATAVPRGLTEIVGLDISPSRVAEAQMGVTRAGPATPRLRFEVGDEGTLDAVRGDGFDIALCIAVFGQVYDLYGLGRRLRDVLRPGGWLVAEFANYAYVRRRVALLTGGLPTVSPASMTLWPEIGWDTSQVHYFTRATCVRFIQQLGLDVKEVHSTGLLANVLRVWPGLFATGFVVAAQKPREPV